LKNLAAAVQNVQTGSDSEKQWALTSLAEIAARLGRNEEAEGYFKQALSIHQRSSYLLATYADFLLDRQRPEEALRLLDGEVRADALLLRTALAEQSVQSPGLTGHVEALKARFAASRLRGDTTHQGDEARFTLHLLNDPRTALELATANWAVQREPRDARILLEAALADGKPQAGQAVLDAMAHSGLEDSVLKGLANRMMGGKS
jgi:tetratricopeptide (TPR) repeat protein